MIDLYLDGVLIQLPANEVAEFLDSFLLQLAPASGTTQPPVTPPAPKAKIHLYWL